MTNIMKYGVVSLVVLLLVFIVFSLPHAFTREFNPSIADRVRLAVIKRDLTPDAKDGDDLGKLLTVQSSYLSEKTYTFHKTQMVSLYGDVCGSFQRPNGTSEDFYYAFANGAVFLKSASPAVYGAMCAKEGFDSETRGKTWNLICIVTNARVCWISTSFFPDGTVGDVQMLIAKSDANSKLHSLVLKNPRLNTGDTVSVTTSERTDTCSLENGEHGHQVCGDNLTQDIVGRFLASGSMTITIGGVSKTYTKDQELIDMLVLVDKFLLTFPGGETHFSSP